ncbi:GATA zinc finger domain-containing protein 8 [Ceratobasidium theobromae]|uniref:GATA zinc finger domain-containing protein 8 n=1 Tax=Ceratobasidium theobromae TaxID=1582974 RepID=A0A5N5QWB2_9AGAM|nr:GATA zinc finger domain-containing protein 8 [Ceratobasidium theobromae]
MAPDDPPRRPSPTTLAAATAEQRANGVSRETAFQDGALLILSHDTEHIFVLSSLSYEHVLDSALAHLESLKDVERSQLRLAVQTRIGACDTLVQVPPETWDAVAARAQVVSVVVASKRHRSHEPSPPRGWHPHPPTAYTHSRQHPYAHVHYVPATDAAFVSDDKRRWDQVDDDPPRHDERKAKRTRAWNPPDHQYSCRRCNRTDSPAWRKVCPSRAYTPADRVQGPDGPKTLCNACGLSYAKEAARREAASTSAPVPPPERPFAYSVAGNSRSGRGAGVKTLDGTALSPDTFPGPDAPMRECTVCSRTDSPQWRKGPHGPNTLCNSCGLSWARTQRKSDGPPDSRSPSPPLKTPTYHPAAGPIPTLAENIDHGRALPRSLASSLADREHDHSDDQHTPSSPSHRSHSPAHSAS